MGSAPPAARVFFPLDEELQLAPGSLAPGLHEAVVRLGTWIPFPRLPSEVHFLTGTDVSEPTARRATEKAGEAYVAVQSAEVIVIEQDRREESPPGPPRQQISVDGAMVPLRGKGEWAEVKTLAIGTIQPPVRTDDGGLAIHTTELSYFSRLADHETFARLATVETYRRGTLNAGSVGAVVDGADWEQKFVDLHRPDAVRILDWGHAAEHIAAVGQALFGVGTEATKQWVAAQLHELKHGDPRAVLQAVRSTVREPGGPGEDAPTARQTVVGDVLAYLEKRQDQIRYAEFQAQGYPIGSGIVESANKLVVEARLKGAGMHWARAHVNPMVALRTVACSDRWDEAWPAVTQRLRAAARERTADRRTRRVAERAAIALSELSTPPLAPQRPMPRPPDPIPDARPAATPPETAVRTPHRPADNHPWRLQRLGRAQLQPTRPLASAKN